MHRRLVAGALGLALTAGIGFADAAAAESTPVHLLLEGNRLVTVSTDAPSTATADVVVGGVELVTLYSELADPVEQRRRLSEQADLAGLDPEAMDLDEDYLRALEYGLAPTGGMGLGIDRLLRLLTGEPSLRQIITFPLLRPE